jgi:hypothetical protein
MMSDFVQTSALLVRCEFAHTDAAHDVTKPIHEQRYDKRCAKQNARAKLQPIYKSLH